MIRMSGASHIQVQSPTAGASVHISINGETSEIPEGCTVERLLGLLDVRGRRVAIALNGAVVPRSGHAGTVIHRGDRIEILEAVGGG